EEEGASHVPHGVGEGRDQRLVGIPLPQHEHVLHDDHRRVDDDPEVDGAHRDQVGGYALQVEEEERPEQRQRDDGGHDERGTPVAQAEEQEQHEDDQRDALDHVATDRVQRALDQLGAVVVRHDAYARRQIVAIDLLDLRPHPRQDVEGVLATTQEHDPLHDVVVVGLLERLADRGLRQPDASQPQPVADHDARQVGDADRRAVARGDGDAPDVVEFLYQAEAAHDVPVRAVLYVGAARVLVAGLQRVQDVLQGQAVRPQLPGVDQHLVLLGRATEPDDVDDPGHRAQAALDDPVLDRLQLGERHLWRPFEPVPVDLSHRRRIRPD